MMKEKCAIFFIKVVRLERIQNATIDHSYRKLPSKQSVKSLLQINKPFMSCDIFCKCQAASKKYYILSTNTNPEENCTLTRFYGIRHCIILVCIYMMHRTRELAAYLIDHHETSCLSHEVNLPLSSGRTLLIIPRSLSTA